MADTKMWITNEKEICIRTLMFQTGLGRGYRDRNSVDYAPVTFD